MIRTTLLTFAALVALRAQDTPPPVAPPPPAIPVVTLDVAPLAPPDLASPYASPRDGARQRFQAAMAQLQSDRDLKAAIKGFTEAYSADRTYAQAAFNLGVIAAIAEQWDTSLAALEGAARLDPAGLGKLAAPSIERLRKVSALESTPQGKLQRRYDEALYPVLQKLPKLPPADAMQAVAEVGRIDPKRWEAPSILAGLNGNGHGYDVAAKFLEIAVANAADSRIKARLEKALAAARRELAYDAARAAADAAADRGEYDKAGTLYENAWAAMPARSSNGMEAASVYLLHDDTARACTLLARLQESADPELGPLASAMLKELEPIEPGAKAKSADAREFFRDPGSHDPVILADLIPTVNTSNMEVLMRPLPKLVVDSEPVVLLAALSINPAEPTPATAAPQPAAPLSNSADVSAGAKIHRTIQVTSQPAGARVFAGDGPEPLCETPCTLKAAARAYSVRLSLAGYRDETSEVTASSKAAEIDLALTLARGNIIIDGPAGATVKVNGTPVPNPAPVELALAPGLYRFTIESGQSTHERTINLKPGARVRLQP